MTAWGILAQATLDAAIAISIDKGCYQQLRTRPGDLSASVKAVLVEAIPTVKQEWQEASHMGEAFLRTMVNAQANQYGIEALKHMGLL